MVNEPAAIGFLRSDVSGAQRQWDVVRIRCVARRLGYILSRTVMFGAYTDGPVRRVIEIARAHQADAVIVPGLAHLGGRVPPELVAVADLITVAPEETYARWLVSPDAPLDMGRW